MPRLRDDQLLRALGARIQAIRNDRGFTQEQLAREVDLRPATISRLECGTLNTSLSNLAQIASVLEVTLAELVSLGQAVPELESPRDEAELLRAYRSLDEERKGIARRLIVGLGRA